jgi:DNA-binding transcriptional regulator WhiA
MKNQHCPEYKIYKSLALKMYSEENISLTKLAKKLQLDRATITNWVRQSKIHIRKDGKIPIDSYTFSKVDTEEKAYWLGFLYADGNVYKTSIELSLSLKDVNHLRKFKDFIKWQGEIKIDNKVGRCRIIFKDKMMVEDLYKLGCTERKSLTVKFPTEEQVPKELQLHFIRGYFDGDGCINDPMKNGLGLSLIGTKHFLNGVLNNFLFDNKLKVKNIKQSQEIFHFQLSGMRGRWFLKNLYENANIFLERKKERYESHLCKCKEQKYGRKCLDYEIIKN